MKTIKTDTHLLLVDETVVIKTSDWYLDLSVFNNNTTINKGIYQMVYPKWGKEGQGDCAKIIASFPKLEGVAEFETLPPNTEGDEMCMFDKAQEYAIGTKSPNREAHRQGFVEGYKQAKSKMFSLNEVKGLLFQVGNAMRYKGVNYASYFNYKNVKEEVDKVLQSLTKPKEYEFVPEMENDIRQTASLYPQPKILNNKIQGTWKGIPTF